MKTNGVATREVIFTVDTGTTKEVIKIAVGEKYGFRMIDEQYPDCLVVYKNLITYVFPLRNLMRFEID